MKASKAAGLTARFGTAFLDQPGNIANAGDVALGHYVAHAFNADANGKDSEVFAEDYKSKTGHYPVYIEGQTVFGLQMAGSVLKGVKAQDGKLNVNARSEEHTSELQSLMRISYAVFCLKKKQKKILTPRHEQIL